MSLYVARHGETLESMTDNLAGPDAMLTALGEDQARQVAEDLAGKLVLEQISRIVTSPRVRTLRTTAIIADFFNMPEEHIKTDDRLREWDLAPFVGLRRGQVFSLPESELLAGGAEKRAAFVSRNHAVYEDAIKLPGITLLVTHQGNIPVLCNAAGVMPSSSPPPTQALLLHE